MNQIFLVSERFTYFHDFSLSFIAVNSLLISKFSDCLPYPYQLPNLAKRATRGLKRK